MKDQRKDFPEFYLTSLQPCPYLENRLERKLFTHLGSEKSVSYFHQLHTSGFRRSQTIAYRPHCEGCSACISVRIVVDDFERTKSQKRIWNLNKDLRSHRLDALSSSEQYALFKAYVEQRHFDGGMAGMSYFDYQAMIEDTVIESFVAEYRLDHSANSKDQNKAQSTSSDLIGVALCDQLNDGISLVYSFFEPSLQSRSLGSYIILETVEYARSLGLPYVYLGYWVEGSQKMDYKTRFQPQEHLIGEDWVLYQGKNLADD